jgi:hypothetical protein
MTIVHTHEILPHDTTLHSGALSAQRAAHSKSFSAEPLDRLCFCPLGPFFFLLFLCFLCSRLLLLADSLSAEA